MSEYGIGVVAAGAIYTDIRNWLQIQESVQQILLYLLLNTREI